jgi:hypothetical protein
VSTTAQGHRVRQARRRQAAHRGRGPSASPRRRWRCPDWASAPTDHSSADPDGWNTSTRLLSRVGYRRQRPRTLRGGRVRHQGPRPAASAVSELNGWRDRAAPRRFLRPASGGQSRPPIHRARGAALRELERGTGPAARLGGTTFAGVVTATPPAPEPGRDGARRRSWSSSRLFSAPMRSTRRLAPGL